MGGLMARVAKNKEMRRPATSPNHSRGTHLIGVSRSAQSPARARAISSLETGRVQGLPAATRLS